MIARFGLLILLLFFAHFASAQVCRVHDHHPPGIQWEITTPHPLISAALFPKHIGVAFHILHQGGPENISLESIRTQVDVLNERFNGTEFSFYLALVTRTENPDWVQLSNEGVPPKTIRDALLIDPDHIINVFIGDMVDGALGWSVFTDSADPQSHAVVIDFVALPGGPFDPDFDSGVTLVHEFGHYFSLRHPYERGCLEDPTKGDFVGDTPPASESWFRQCPAVADSCPTLPGSDPVANYMYATTDACRVTWSPGQIDRMQQKISEFRPDIGGSTINLPPGLSILPNSEWYFYEGSYHISPDAPLIVKGGLYAQNASFTSSELSWQGIQFEEGSVGQFINVEINQVITPADAAALLVDNAYVTLDSVQVDVLPASTRDAIHVSGEQSRLYMTHSYVIQNSNSPAIQVTDGGIVHFGRDSSDTSVGLNRISGGKLVATTNGEIYAGQAPGQGSYNHFCDQLSSQLETSEGGAIYATHNFWYNDLAPSLTGANIIYNNKLGASDCSALPVVNVNVERPLPSVPDVYKLSNQPNPFNGTTTISFHLPSAGHVQLTVYDLLGRPITTLINEFRSSGPHKVSFEGINMQSGVYVYQLVTPHHIASKLMVFAR